MIEKSGEQGAGNGLANQRGDHDRGAAVPGAESPGVGEPERIPVVAAVIRRGDSVLLCRRPEGKRHGGKWEFPGGKVRRGESVRDAAARELREELALDLEAFGPELLELPDPGSPFSIHFHEVEAGGAPEAREHSEIRWCRPDVVCRLDLAPADAFFARCHLLPRP